LDPALDRCAFFVVVRCDQLQHRNLCPRIVVAVDLRKGLKPGLSALLTNNSIQAPRSQCVIEAFVPCTPCHLLWRFHPSVVEIREIVHSVHFRSCVHPRIAAAADRVRKPAGTLEYPRNVRRSCSLYRLLVEGEMLVQIELGDEWIAIK